MLGALSCLISLCLTKIAKAHNKCAQTRELRRCFAPRRKVQRTGDLYQVTQISAFLWVSCQQLCVAGLHTRLVCMHEKVTRLSKPALCNFVALVLKARWHCLAESIRKFVLFVSSLALVGPERINDDLGLLLSCAMKERRNARANPIHAKSLYESDGFCRHLRRKSIYTCV